FVVQWRQCQSRNNLNNETLQQIIKQKKRRSYRLSNKADKFLNDLNAEIEQGWTDHGQTNRLLGRITMRTYVFHHVMYGGEPLTGDSLIKEVLAVARGLPGYELWCRHQHEIEDRVSEWVSCIEKSHYFHYGEQFGKYKSKKEESESKILSPAGINSRVKKPKTRFKRLLKNSQMKTNFQNRPPPDLMPSENLVLAVDHYIDTKNYGIRYHRRNPSRPPSLIMNRDSLAMLTRQTVTAPQAYYKV
ncbi:MAG: hypothetical protein AAFX51_17280, partial [Cyanobacteria bacterium J06636_28]